MQLASFSGAINKASVSAVNTKVSVICRLLVLFFKIKAFVLPLHVLFVDILCHIPHVVSHTGVALVLFSLEEGLVFFCEVVLQLPN